LSCHFRPFISSSLQIAPKKFQEIFAADRVTSAKQRALLAENDWRPEWLPELEKSLAV
jgi:hypothetical protein